MAYDPSIYEAQRRSYADNYASTGAMNAYSNFLSQQRGQRDLGDLQTQWQQATPKFIAGYGRRNLINPNIRSGAFSRALQDFSNQNIRQISDAQQALDQQQQMFQLGQQNLLGSYNSNLSNLEADKARQIAADAQALLQYRAGV